MDSYVDPFQAAGGSMVMLAKGNRSQQVHRGLLRSTAASTSARSAAGGTPGARQHQEGRVLEYPELGMEAVWKIEVENFPAFIVVDDKGNDFYAQVRSEAAMPGVAQHSLKASSSAFSATSEVTPRTMWLITRSLSRLSIAARHVGAG